MTTSPERPAPTPRPSAWVGALVGVIVTAVAVATGHLVANVTTPDASPVIAVGQAAIDATPEWLKSFAIRTFGSNDKKVLLGGIFLTLAVIAMAIGALSVRRRWVGFAGIAGLTLLAIAAALTRPTATLPTPLPALVAGLAAAGAYALLLRSLAPRDRAAGEAAAMKPRASRRRLPISTGAGSWRPRPRWARQSWRAEERLASSAGTRKQQPIDRRCRSRFRPAERPHCRRARASTSLVSRPSTLRSTASTASTRRCSFRGSSSPTGGSTSAAWLIGRSR